MLVPIQTSLLCLALAGAPLAQETPDEKAQALLQRAVFAYEHERYLESVKLYRLLARKYPTTSAGAIAAQRSAPNAVLGVHTIVNHGPSNNRVDIALMGDGFTIQHQKTFNNWAADIPDVFEQQRLFREYFSYFNFHNFHIVSEDSNVDGYGRKESTALGGLTHNTVQGHVGVDARLVRAALESLPDHDGQALVYVRAGNLGTASDGIAAIGGRSAGTTIHEWGHSFARLSDEYTTFTHARGEVRSGINISNTEEQAKLPWLHWIEARAKGVGAYQGGAGRERGAWRPTASGCVMQSGEFFCAPCREALLLRIYSLVDPIESVNYPVHPYRHPASLVVDTEFEFQVQVMRPRSHKLEVSWWLLAPEEVQAISPKPKKAADPRYSRPLLARGNRHDRGPLTSIERKPDQHSHINKSGLHSFTIKAKQLAPGRYRLICRAKDSTHLPGERLPWVLRDEDDLLQSQRAWWITIPTP